MPARLVGSANKELHGARLSPTKGSKEREKIGEGEVVKGTSIERCLHSLRTTVTGVVFPNAGERELFVRVEPAIDLVGGYEGRGADLSAADPAGS